MVMQAYTRKTKRVSIAAGRCCRFMFRSLGPRCAIHIPDVGGNHPSFRGEMPYAEGFSILMRSWPIETAVVVCKLHGGRHDQLEWQARSSRRFLSRRALLREQGIALPAGCRISG